MGRTTSSNNINSSPPHCEGCWGSARARARVCVCVFGVINYFVTYWGEVSKKISGETGVGVGVVKTFGDSDENVLDCPLPLHPPNNK